MLKIFLSIPGDLSDTNGTTIRTIAIANLLKADFNIKLVTRANSINNEVMLSHKFNKDMIITIKPKGTKLWNFKLLNIILNNKIDCVICESDLFGFFSFIFLRPFFKYKIIYEAHALAHKEISQTSRIKGYLYKLMEIIIAEKSDAIVSLSLNTKAFFIKYNKNTFHIPVYIDFPTIKMAQNEHAGKVIGLIGPFDTVSNRYQIEFLYKYLNCFDKKIRFLIIGKCNNRIVDSKVNYTGYLDSKEEYLNALFDVDAILVPVCISTYGPKNKILEAMSLGKPVFTTPEGVVGLDYAKPNKDIIVEAEDNLINNINFNLLHNYEYIKNIGIFGKHLVNKYYIKRIYLNQYKKIILSVINKKNIDE